MVIYDINTRWVGYGSIIDQKWRFRIILNFKLKYFSEISTDFKKQGMYGYLLDEFYKMCMLDFTQIAK